MYKIIGADGKQYGPISADQLRQWLADSRVNAQTFVCAEGEAEWKPLAAIPEFAADLNRSTAPQPFSAQQYGQASVAKTNGMAVTGLVMGLVSVTVGPFCCCTFYGIPFSVLGIIFSLIGLSQINRSQEREQGRGMAIAGLILSILSVALAALMTIIGGAMLLLDGRH